MKNYNNMYRKYIYNQIQKHVKNGLEVEEAISRCSKSAYCLFSSLYVNSNVLKNANPNSNSHKVLETMLVSVLYIDFMKFMNAQIAENDDLSPVLKSKYESMLNCESYEEVLDIFKKNYNIFNLAVDSVYEIEEKSAFMKIIYANILDENVNSKILSIFPNYQEDIDQFNFQIDKDYIVNKINQMCKSDVNFELVLCDLMAFTAWIKYNNPELYNLLVKDMVDDMKKFVDEIDDTFDTSGYGEVLNNFVDNSKMNLDETIEKFDEDEANVRYGVTAFICEETDYRKKYFGEPKKI